MMLVHGEHYLEWKRPLPTSATLINEFKVVDILNKGKAAVLIIGATLKDAASGEEYCYNEYSNFIRGVTGVGNKASGDRGAATAANDAPKRAPDAVVTEKTTPEQAALYRLSGDRNPLHIDPEMSKMGGFDVPILHGYKGVLGLREYHKRVTLDHLPLVSAHLALRASTYSRRSRAATPQR